MISIEEILIKNASLSTIRKRLKDQSNASEKAQLIQKQLPELVCKTVSEADRILEGKLLLPGTDGIPKFVGNPPHWFQIMNGYDEFLWQLNRMDHWQPLLEAFSYTGEEKYAVKVIQELEDWIEAIGILEEDYSKKEISFFSSIHPMRVLECGIRLYKTWPLIIEHLSSSELFTEEILKLYLLSIYKQAEIIRWIAPQLWQNADHNHYLMECLGLFETALLFPELNKSEEWKNFSYNELMRCSRNQLTDLGGQIEGCPSYHNGCIYWFGLVMVLAIKFSITVSEEYRERFIQNLNYSIYSMRPTGKSFPIGDSHANDLSVMAATYGYLALGETYWLQHLSMFMSTEKIKEKALTSIWDAIDVEEFIKDIHSMVPLSSSESLPLNLFNPELGQSFVRSDWTKDAHSFAHTCRSPIQNQHAHIDLLSFEYIALNKNIICDPGLYSYLESEERREFKSTASHSTVMLNNQDHFEYISTWGYGPQQKGELDYLKEGRYHLTSHGHHESYKPTVVNRFLSLIDDKFLLVIDSLSDVADYDEITRTFHLDYTEVHQLGDAIEGIDSEVSVKLVNFPFQESTIQIGKLSDVNDIYRESRKVVYNSIAKENQNYLTVIYPYRSEFIAPEIIIEEIIPGTYQVTENKDNSYQVQLDGKDIDIIKVK